MSCMYDLFMKFASSSHCSTLKMSVIIRMAEKADVLIPIQLKTNFHKSSNVYVAHSDLWSNITISLLIKISLSNYELLLHII